MYHVILKDLHVGRPRNLRASAYMPRVAFESAIKSSEEDIHLRSPTQFGDNGFVLHSCASHVSSMVVHAYIQGVWKIYGGICKMHNEEIKSGSCRTDLKSAFY